MKKVGGRCGVSIQEFEAACDAVEDVIKRMIMTDERVDWLTARLEEIEGRLKWLEGKSEGC